MGGDRSFNNAAHSPKNGPYHGHDPTTLSSERRNDDPNLRSLSLSLSLFHFLTRTLILSLPLTLDGFPPLSLSLSTLPSTTVAIRVRGKDTRQYVYGEEVNAWIGNILKRDVILIVKGMEEKPVEEARFAPLDEGKELNFPNESQFLGINLSSVTALNRDMAAEGLPPVLPNRFRPNLLFDHPVPFSEDAWEGVRIGSILLKVAGPCVRCKMINIHQESGAVLTQPYLYLLKCRVIEGRVRNETEKLGSEG